MSTSQTPAATELRHIRRGAGPDVVLIGGLGDPAESWQPQLDGLADRYSVVAFDNRGAGTSPLPADGPLTTASMADDTAQLMRDLGIERAHVGGFSGGGMVAQELALRHPDRVRSLVLNGSYACFDELMRRQLGAFRWLPEHAPSERAFLELFLTVVYTNRFHESGAVDAIVDEMLSDPNAQTLEGLQAQIDAYLAHDSRGRLASIDVPTLVLSGSEDIFSPRRHSEQLTALIPGAEHVVIEGGGHQPFQEDPDHWNGLVDAFWRRVEEERR
jgi:pimeloyl-ACP methyl ester carboxylesterase